MISTEETEHSFIIKIWVEESAKVYPPGLWRGHITHVMSNERQYFQTLAGIESFVSIYLKQMKMQDQRQKDNNG